MGGPAVIALENRPNARQVSRADQQERNKKSDIEWSEVMQWAHDKPDHCRVVTTHPEPMFILASNQQLIDLKRFACG